MTVKQLSDFLATVPPGHLVCVEGLSITVNYVPVATALWDAQVLGLKMDTVLDCVVIG